MHAGFGPVRGSQTTGSWCSVLPTGGSPATHWVTGTAAPCLSIRVPVWFDAVEAAGLPDRGPAPGGTYSSGSIWWDHEVLHRTVLSDYSRLRGLIEPERRELQARIDAAAAGAAMGGVQDRVECTRAAFAEAIEAYRRWSADVRRAAPVKMGLNPFHRAWRGFDRAARRE
jgi:hypothetical protein